ncbi:MAG: GH116 family glycosyl-hydrolase, partial [Roseiflexaceae bacterium]
MALPLGGIGTGTVSLGGRGNLHDWEIVNRPAKGFTPSNCFFALYAEPAGGPSVTRALEGALTPHYEGSSGSTAANHGLPRFRSCSFAAAYPFGQVLLA